MKTKTFWATRQKETPWGNNGEIILTLKKPNLNFDDFGYLLSNNQVDCFCAKMFLKLAGFLPRKGTTVEVKLVKVTTDS